MEITNCFNSCENVGKKPKIYLWGFPRQSPNRQNFRKIEAMLAKKCVGFVWNTPWAFLPLEYLWAAIISISFLQLSFVPVKSRKFPGQSHLLQSPTGHSSAEPLPKLSPPKPPLTNKLPVFQLPFVILPIKLHGDQTNAVTHKPPQKENRIRLTHSPQPR